MGTKTTKRLYVVCRNHMDPSWLRCFVNHYRDENYGGVVRPYSELEEQQILEYMNFAELYGVKYQIEQSAVVKKFLERNPDQKERLKTLVQKGLIELAGGGECVIDRNMSVGESWARNHLYSIAYYKKEFGRIPRYAITPDMFGLPAQLPQFFRSVGYDADIVFDRVMLENKPFWQGLDGTKIVLDNQYLGPGYPRSADCVKLLACAACHGEGCPVCNGTGIDPTYDMTRPDKICEHQSYWGNVSADEFLDTLAKEDKTVYYTQITAEETRVGNYLFKQLNEAAPRHGFEIHYVTYEENHDRWCEGQVEALRRGDTPDELTDHRAEGNPVFNGCYSARMEIKKANAELENALLAAERLATIVKAAGGWDPDTKPRRDYPAEKIASLWNKMSFIQFHDCLPGTVVNAAYEELQCVIRQVRAGAAQIYRDAAREYCKVYRITPPAGYEAAVCFNTDVAPDEYPTLTLHGPADLKNVEIVDAAGNELPVFSLAVTPERVGVGVTCRVRAEIPALGHRVFFWRALTEEKAVDKTARKKIENDFFTLCVGKNGTEALLNKKTGKKLLGENACELSLTEDKSGPYICNKIPGSERRLIPDTVSFAVEDGCQSVTLSGSLTDPERGVDSLQWKETLSLAEKEPLLRAHVSFDWKGKCTSLHALFPSAFATDGKQYDEVGFGMLARDPLSNPADDDWPSLGYVGFHGDGNNVGVLKAGLPAARLKDSVLDLTLHRAGDPFEPRYDGITDCGHHECTFAVAAWDGEFTDGDPAALAASFGLPCHTEPYFADWAGQKEMPEIGVSEKFSFLATLPKNVCLSALKPAENGDGYVIRVWESTGKQATWKLPAAVKLQPTNTLEEPTGKETAAEVSFRPFEIATFRVIL